jgi:hypothetical protein
MEGVPEPTSSETSILLIFWGVVRQVGKLITVMPTPAPPHNPQSIQYPQNDHLHFWKTEKFVCGTKRRREEGTGNKIWANVIKDSHQREAFSIMSNDEDMFLYGYYYISLSL